MLQEYGIHHPFEALPDRSPHFSLIDRFDALLTIGRELASTRDTPLLLERTRAAFQTLLRPTLCEVVLLEDIALERSEKPFSQHLWNQVLESKSLVVSGEDSAQSVMLTPLSLAGRVFAVVAISQTGLKRYFGEEEVRLARWLVTQAEVALENVHTTARSDMRQLELPGYDN